MTAKTDNVRRRVLRSAAALCVGLPAFRAAHAASPSPTPAQALGPFYPRVLPADRDNDLVQIAGRDRPAAGTVAYVDGRVGDARGQPVAGALVEIWQCDVHGRYLRPADDGPGPRDDNFQGYGQVRTDAAGAYGFRTIRPVPYGGRPPHIHFQVTHPRYPKLVTQLYAPDTASGGARWEESTYPSLWVTFAPASREPGAVAARFDIVLAAPA
jgi:protocatechuate 3,4-dioxygenase beta subunit